MNKYSLRHSPLVAAIGSSLVTAGASAATITVTSNDDGPVGSITNACTLRDAIEAANLGAASGGCDSGSFGTDKIVFAAKMQGASITLSYGQITIDSPVTITGPAPEDPAGMVIVGNSPNPLIARSRIFAIQGAFPGHFDVRLENLTLATGSTVSDDAPGGAIWSKNANLSLEHTLLTFNETSGAASSGGSVYLTLGNLALLDSTVADNSTSGQSSEGGGIAVQDGNLELVRSTISGNTSETSSGGGISVKGGGNLVIEDSVLTNNMCNRWGGGIRMVDADVYILDSMIYNNTAGILGGGIAATTDSGNVVLKHTQLLGNLAEYHGGGGISVLANQLVLEQSAIADNTAVRSGGGVALYNGTGTIRNSTISGNATQSSEVEISGGGISSFDSELTLVHSTIANNSASGNIDGIGFNRDEDDREFTLLNSIIAQAGESETACSKAATKAVNSLATDVSCTGTAASMADIDLLPLAENGGSTPTHAITLSSVAANATGNCTKDFGIDTDQRGQPRPGAGTASCDIGAYEGQREDEVFEDRFEQ